MKTENLPATGDSIWTNNSTALQQLSNEECLPVMGGCQISSILQTLDGNLSTEENIQNMDLIIIQSNDYKPLQAPPAEAAVNLQNGYVVLKETGNVNTSETTPKSNKKKTYGEDSFENMLYFVCNLCPFLCTKDEKITEHLENAHKNKNVSQLSELKCPACANIFYHKISLRSHLVHDHGVCVSDLNLIVQAVVYYSNKNKIKSKINRKDCTQELSSVKSLQDSIVELADSTESDNYFQLESKVEATKNTPTVKVNLPQVDLLAQASSENIITSLMTKSDPASKYVSTRNCPVPSCKVRLTDVEKLKYHISCHFENTFKCLECSELFNFWKPLSSHLWRTHQIDMELFSCDKCEYKTYSLSKLNNVHKLIHGEVKAFVCSVCNKAFKNYKQLSNHKLTHSEKKNKESLECEECSKTFFDKRNLKVHMEGVHQRIKPYLCSYCGYKGSSRSSLNTHIRRHTGEKPFACEHCSYATSDHNSLRKHKLRHTGQKPYKCAHCSYACIQSSTYKIHLKTKHPGMERDLMFTCMYCQFRSVNKEMYVIHMVTVHQQKPTKDMLS